MAKEGNKMEIKANKLITDQLYYYKATVVSVVDGDTVKLRVDLGFRSQWVSNCRLAGINAMEMADKDPTLRARAIEAKKYIEDKLPAGTEVVVRSTKLDKYGRPVVVVYYGQYFLKNLNNELLSAKLVESY